MTGEEECDDANLDDTDDCVSSCTLARCGDGHVQGGVEECDDGNLVSDDMCSNTCSLPVCGDGLLNSPLEECDDGNALNYDACLEDCVLAECGDGYHYNAAEECDDGNLDNSDACLEGCVLAECGDGYLYTGFEDCDDGNNLDGDGCPADCVLPCGPRGDVIYVRATASGAATGESWEDAYSTVFQATMAAEEGDEIWVAEGVYRAASPHAPVVELQTCVNVRGGFVGDEATPDERPDPIAISTLSGDFSHDDAAGQFDDNSYHVVLGADVYYVELDGFSLEAGRAFAFGDNRFGGGILLRDSLVDLTDLHVSDNEAVYQGGGVYARGSEITGRGLTVDSSRADLGGGIFLSGTEFDLQELVVSENWAQNWGGGIYVGAGSNVLASGQFFANVGSSGGGAYVLGEVQFSEVDFVGNVALSGAGVDVGSGGTASFEDCLFHANEAAGNGGGARLGADSSFSRCLFDSNISGGAGGALRVEGGAAVADEVWMLGNAAVSGGAVSLGGGAPGGDEFLARDSVFAENSADTSGGAVHVAGSNQPERVVTLRRVRLEENTAGEDGGAVYIGGGIPRPHGDFGSCHFRSNTAGGYGGAVFVAGSVVVADSAMVGNESPVGGGGMALATGSAIETFRVQNSSFFENAAGVPPDAADGGAILLLSGQGGVANSVFWGNGGDIEGATADTTVEFSCSEYPIPPGPGNVLVGTEPFVLGPEGQLYLDESTMCIDAGDDAAATSTYLGLGLDWQSLSTHDDGSLDAPPVDVGVHYPP